MKKNNLDERQEQTLLHIEKNGCWIAFWGLLAALMIQMIIYGPEFKHIAGEWIVFMVLAFYLTIGCMKNGIWDRNIRPTVKNNLIASLIAGVGFGVVMLISMAIRFPGKWKGIIAGAAISGLSVFVLCFLALSVAKKAYEKKQAKLDSEPEEEEI